MPSFLAYLKYPNSVLVKNPKIHRITLIFPDSPDIPCGAPLAKCAAPNDPLFLYRKLPLETPLKACLKNHAYDDQLNLPHELCPCETQTIEK